MPRQSKRRRVSTSPDTTSNMEGAGASLPEGETSPSASLQNYNVAKVYRLLEPGPVVLVSTHHNGKSNLMTMGFHMVMQHEGPPLLGAIIGPWDHSFKALKASKECVLAVPGVDLAEKVADIGNCSAAEDIDKFERFGFTTVPGQKVSAPLVEECLYNIECKVYDTKMVSAYNLWVLRPVRAWCNPDREEKRTFHHKGDGMFTIDGEQLDLQERMVKWKEYQD